MRKRFYLGIVILLNVALISLSAEGISLDKDTCLSQALENNSDLLSAALRLETSRRAEDASWNAFLPEMNASVGFSGSAAAAEGSSTRAFGINPGLSVSYALNPGIREALRQLDLEVEKDSINYEGVRLRLLMNVESEFYYLLTIRNNLEIVRKNIELADRQYEQTRVKFTSGLVSELEVLQARVNAANLRPGYSSLETAYRSRLKEFLAVLGIDPRTEVELVGSLDVEDRAFDADELIETYLDNRTDIRAQRKQLEVLDNSLTLAKRNGRLPLVTLSASWVENLSFPFAAAGSGSLTLGVKLGLDDYIPGSSTDIGIREIEDAIESAELVLEDLILSAGLEIRNVIDSLATDRENLELSLLNLELSEKSYRMTEESFLRGRSNRMQLDDAQQDLLTARQNLLESRYEYMNDLITLRGALGLDSLEELEK